MASGTLIWPAPACDDQADACAPQRACPKPQRRIARAWRDYELELAGQPLASHSSLTVAAPEPRDPLPARFRKACRWTTGKGEKYE